MLSNEIHSAGEQDVEKAYTAAQNAFKGTWGQLDPKERSTAMLKFANLVRDKAEELAALETKAMGSAIATQITCYKLGADLFTYYAGLTDKIKGEASYPTSDGKYIITQREPLGVCAGIGAWNVPAVLFSWKSAVSLSGPLLIHSKTHLAN